MAKQITKTHLQEIRDALLDLHQALLEYERRLFEKKENRVVSPGQMYDLITNHNSFHWLRSLSSLIVSMDEIIDAKRPLSMTVGLVQYIKKLLTPHVEGVAFSKKYDAALQNFPEALIAHGKVMQAIKAAK